MQAQSKEWRPHWLHGSLGPPALSSFLLLIAALKEQLLLLLGKKVLLGNTMLFGHKHC